MHKTGVSEHTIVDWFCHEVCSEFILYRGSLGGSGVVVDIDE